eukprot:153645-Pleurochrysis_carterae.AAC.4
MAANRYSSNLGCATPRSSKPRDGMRVVLSPARRLRAWWAMRSRMHAFMQPRTLTGARLSTRLHARVSARACACSRSRGGRARPIAPLRRTSVVCASRARRSVRANRSRAQGAACRSSRRAARTRSS